MPDVNSFPRGIPRRDPASFTLPKAEWVQPESLARDAKWRFVPGTAQIFLGQADGQLIGIEDDRHLMTIAGSRAGKGVSTVIPNLIEYPGSILVIDPKGENAARTANRRRRPTSQGGLGQKVYVLDPFGRSGHATAAFNPLDMIDHESDTAIDDAALIAEGLVIPRSGESGHWSDSARNFLRGLVLYVCVVCEKERNLPRVRKLLTLDQDRFEQMLAEMAALGDKCHGLISRAAHTLLAKSENERSGVISTAIEQTGFLDSPRMASILRRSDFDLKDLKRKKITVYLCLPAGRMVTHNRWLRIMINLAVQAMEDEVTMPDSPVLFVMDEFAVLDHMASVEKAAGQIAGFGVKLWPIIQDLSQLKSIYQDRWETFMGNAGFLQFFGNSDLTTLEYLSARLGKTMIVQVQQSRSSVTERAHNKDAGRSEQRKRPGEAVLTEDQAARSFAMRS